jgi:hypothetical protein
MKIRRINFSLTQTLTTKPGARTMGLNAAAHKIYLPTAEMLRAVQGHVRLPSRIRS